MARLLERVFINARLGRLLAGQVVSQMGDSLYQIALVWMMLDLTGSKSLTGLVAGALFVPTLLFGIPAGVLADRWSRRGIMIGSDAARTLLVLLIPLGLLAQATTGTLVTPISLATVTFLVATFAAAFNPARDALVPSLVAPAQLPHANALMQTSWQAAILMGPLLASAVLAIVPGRDGGSRLLFYFDALTFFISMLLILSLAKGPCVSKLSGRPTAWQDLAEGLKYVWKSPVMRIVVLVTAIDNVVLMGAAILGPAILVREMGGTVFHYSLAEAALAGGVLVGAPFMATVGRRLPMGRTMLVGVILDGLTYVPLYFIQSIPGLIAMIFVHSFFIPLITVSRATILGTHVPDHLRGRMYAVINVCVIGGMALSVTLVGLLADLISMRLIFLLIGLGAAATALPGFLSVAIKQMDRTAKQSTG